MSGSATPRAAAIPAPARAAPVRPPGRGLDEAARRVDDDRLIGGALVRRLRHAVSTIEATSAPNRLPGIGWPGDWLRDTGQLFEGWRSDGARATIPSMTGRAHKVLEEALSLSEDERLDLAEQLLSSLPADREWLAELERRARRALADPSGGEAWEVLERRFDARFANR